MRYDSSNPEVEDCAFVYRLDQETLIGREASCQIMLDPRLYSTVSRRHAKVIRVPQGETVIWQIRDLKSTNGTYVNGDKVTESRTLQHGDRILFSKAGPEFIFECRPAVSPPAPTNLPSKAPAKQRVAPDKISHLLGLPQRSRVPTTPFPASPAANLAASGLQVPLRRRPNSLWSWAVKTDYQTLLGHRARVQGVAFAAEGDRLASGSADTTIKLWDLASGQETGQLSGHAAAVNAVAFCPNRAILVSGGDDQLIRFWDLRTGQEIRQLSGHTAAVNAVAFSQNGQILASGGADKTIQLWDLSTGGLIRTLIGHQLTVTALAFSPNGLILASGSTDMTIHLWKLENGDLISSFSLSRSSVNGLMFSPDSQLLMVSSADQTTRLWDFAAAQEIWALTGQIWQASGVAISPDGERFACGDQAGAVKVWWV